MRKKATGIKSISGLDIIEEGYSLFKNELSSALLFNLLGSVPFAIGLLYVIGDMSYGQANTVDIVGSALTLTLLWMWNNLWQAVYRTRLVDYRCMRDVTKLNWRTLSRIFMRQNIIQPFGLILSPLAIFPMMWWLTVFFNVYGVDYRDNPGLREQLKRSRDIVGRDLKRVYLLMTVVWVFRTMMIVNFMLIFLFVPALLKLLFGIDTPFSQANSLLSGLRIVFNSTFISCAIVTAWLCYSPLEKAMWSIMVFYGESDKKGYDIIAGLKLLMQQRGMKIIIGLTLICTMILGGLKVGAAETSPVWKQTVSPAQLRNEIKHTLTRREYQWKLPVERSKHQSRSVIGAYINHLLEQIKGTLEWIFNFIDKLFSKATTTKASKLSAFLAWLSVKRYIAIWSVVSLALGIIGWMLFRWWRERQKIPISKATEASIKVVDLTDEENIAADDMDENEWLELAARLIAEGEQKLAMRAMFLAVIKTLADNQLLTIARGKTNRDYRRELMRRSHSEPVKIKLFSACLGIFEKIWYGDYTLANSEFDEFSGNIKQLINLRGSLCHNTKSNKIGLDGYIPPQEPYNQE